MKRRELSAEITDFVSVSKHSCPECSGKLIRTPRRPTDRLLNFLMPTQRYRCSRFSCQWTGNIRVAA